MRLMIYDLDGTLIDSKLDLAHSVNATRSQFGLGSLEHEVIYSYVGHGAPALISRALGPGATDGILHRALDFFISYYRDHCLDYTRLYPGVQETLKAFHQEGMLQAVLTNKPVRVSGMILDGLDVGRYFARVYGGNSFSEKKPDPVGILTLLDEFAVAPEDALMVGDSAVDVQTARNAGIACCGVTYGFQPETLTAQPPDYLVNAFAELRERSQSGWALDGPKSS